MQQLSEKNPVVSLDFYKGLGNTSSSGACRF